MYIKQLPNCDNKLWQPTVFQNADPWTKTQVYDDINAFMNEYGDTEAFPVHLNVVLDFYLKNYEVEDKEYTCLNLMMFHPRKDAIRGIMVNNITFGDLRKIKCYLAKSKRQHMNNFKWIPTIK
jgi:hypothetical protein